MLLTAFLASVSHAADKSPARILVDPAVMGGACIRDVGLNHFDREKGQIAGCATGLVNFRQPLPLKQPIMLQAGVGYDNTMGWSVRLAPGVWFGKVALTAGLEIFPLSMSREEDTTTIQLGVWVRSLIVRVPRTPLAVYSELSVQAGAECWPGLPCEADDAISLRFGVGLDR